ncbi:MAG: winged helix-turn-helix domain-containing protein [Tepidisphaeraceae bacterium]
MPENLADVVSTADRRVISSSALTTRQRCLSLLPEQDRMVMGLLQSDPPASIRQVAALLNRSPGTVSRKAARIRRRLRHPVVIALASRGHTLSSRFFDIAIALFAAGQPPHLVARRLDAETRDIVAIKQYLHGWAKSA